MRPAEKGFRRFDIAINAAAGVAIALAEKQSDPKAFRGVLANTIFGRKGPRQLDRQLTASEKHFGVVFQGYMEIQKCVETLEDIPVYISRYPYRGTRITRDRHLQFMVEVHISEIYLLKERLIRFLRRLERQYKGDPIVSTIRNAGSSLRETVEHAFASIVARRRQHVHDTRFSDEEIDRVSALELLSRNPDSALAGVLKEYYTSVERSVRRSWKSKIKANNEAVHKLLDTYFDVIFPFLLTKGRGC